MEKRILLIIIAVILVVVFAFAVYRFTGQVTKGVGACTDSDGGVNYYVLGTARFTNRNKTYTDYCFAKGPAGVKKWLNEYYCSDYSHISSKNYRCPFGCLNGVCTNQTA